MDSHKESICTKTNDDDNNAFEKHNHDTLVEIMMRVEPSNIFNCMLVSKKWLSVITTFNFWTNYLNRWKDSQSIVVGLLKSDTYGRSCIPEAQLLATSNVGRNMIVRNLIPTGFFISKSPKGNLFLFCDILPNIFYVGKYASKDPPVKLQPPPTYYKSCMANIICSGDDEEDYKVVLVCAERNSNIRPIQIYCSRAEKWESSTLACPIGILLMGCPISSGIVADDIIYWEAHKHRQIDCLAAWDIKGSRISLIRAAPLMAPKKYYFKITYGASLQSQGSLLAATWSNPAYYDWECKWMIINIWALDHDRKNWRFLYGVRHSSIWTKNLSLLKQFFDVRPKEGFHFVSFLPGKSHSVYLGLDQHLFTYNFRTSKLKYVDYPKYGNLGISSLRDGTIYHPLTLLHLNNGSSSPSSLAAPPPMLN